MIKDIVLSEMDRVACNQLRQTSEEYLRKGSKIISKVDITADSEVQNPNTKALKTELTRNPDHLADK
jgi:hypothetical protein